MPGYPAVAPLERLALVPQTCGRPSLLPHSLLNIPSYRKFSYIDLLPLIFLLLYPLGTFILFIFYALLICSWLDVNL